MLLQSEDGSALSLDLVGYEFPTLQGAGDHFDFDANWLVVAGRVTAPRQTWSFREPSLLTTEARELLVWLRAIAGGQSRTDLEDLEDLEFLEPNLSFALTDVADGLVRIRVGLTAECSPPPQKSVQLDLTMPSRAVEVAADRCEAEISAYPER